MQSTHAATWYDGTTAAGAPAEISVAGSVLHSSVAAQSFTIPMTMVQVSAPVAGVPLRLNLPHGGVFVLADANVAPHELGAPAPEGFVNGLERNPAAVVVAVVAVIAIAVFAYRHAIPWLAGEIAARIPIEAEAKLGAATLSTLDRVVLSPSKLAPDKRTEISERFYRLAKLARLEVEPDLVFRYAQRGVGANAFALPGGIVVVTDQLVRRVASSDEVAAALAHELGHVAHRDTMRQMLEQSSSGLILGAVLGDVSGIGSLTAAAPTLLLSLSYSRESERGADDYAIDLLRRAGLSPALLADSLEAIASTECPDAETAGKENAAQCARRGHQAPPPYLSTHPDLEERIERAREAAR